MTPQTAIELEFGDGTYLFDLKLPQLAELQAKREAGVFAIYGRVLRGRYLVEGQSLASPLEGEAFAEDLWETIRLGLIGGGRGLVDGQEIVVTALTASRLVAAYAYSAPLMQSWSLAAAILGARVMGYTPPKARPAAPAPDESAATETTGSTPDRSSVPVPPSEPTGES